MFKDFPDLTKLIKDDTSSSASQATSQTKALEVENESLKENLKTLQKELDIEFEKKLEANVIEQQQNVKQSHIDLKIQDFDQKLEKAVNDTKEQMQSEFEALQSKENESWLSKIKKVNQEKEDLELTSKELEEKYV